MSILELANEERMRLLEQIDAAEKHVDALKARFDTLEEIGLLAAKLEREGEVSAPVTVTPPVAEPAPTPASRTKPGAGRSASRTAKGGTAQSGQAHTASGAPTGGRRHVYDANATLHLVRHAFANGSVPVSASEVARALDLPPKQDRALNAVRAAISTLLTEGVICKAGTGRGGHPKYEAVVRQPERAIPSGTRLPSGVRAGSSGTANVIDQLVDKIVDELKLEGGRVSRGDLHTRLGSPAQEDLTLALDRAVSLRKIEKVPFAGKAGYQVGSRA